MLLTLELWIQQGRSTGLLSRVSYLKSLLVSLPPIRGTKDKQQSSKFSADCLYLTRRVGS